MPLEQLCRYITGPALSDEGVQLNAAGQVELKLKTPWGGGTTHLVMSPLEFMQRLAALVPRPRLHLFRFHGVLATNAKLRPLAVPQGPRGASTGGNRGCSRSRVQSRRGPGPTAPHQLGAAAQTRVQHRHAVPPELRLWGTQDHRGHPRSSGDREGPDPPGAGSTAAANRPGARGGARLKPPEPRQPPGTPDTTTRAACLSAAAGGAAPPADSTPEDSGQTLIQAERAPSEPSGAGWSGQGNGPGASSKPSRHASTAHPALTRAGLTRAIRAFRAFQGPFENPMRRLAVSS